MRYASCMRMSLYQIVEHVYTIEYLPFGVLPSRVYLSFGDPLFKYHEKALSDGIIMTMTPSTHRRY
jgi:hypothetical protein